MLRLLAVIVLLFPSVIVAGESSRPNVLFIAVDDLNDWVGCLGGHPQARTPNIDALAKRGTLFTNAHCNAPLCNPSRTSVMTGLLPSTTGVHGNEQDWHDSPYLKDHPTLPRWFQQHGYHTAACGKIFHANHGGECAALQGGHGGLQGFDDFEAWDDRFPAKDRQLLADVELPGQNKNGLDIWHWDWGPVDASDDETSDGRAVTWASQKLAADYEKPFFLAVGLYRPHSPMYVPREYFDAMPLEEIQLPEAKPDDLDDVPAIAKRFRGTPADQHELIVKRELWDDAVRGYLANISFADAMVGRLMKALDASPHAKNTVVVFWSDHGWHLGEKFKWHKSTLWEESTRVPVIIVAPGVNTTDKRCDRAVSLVDLYPTLCELCDLPKPARLDGASLVPLFRDANADGHPPVVTVLGGQHASVRSDDWRYSRYSDESEELYNHRADPNEWTNLADDAQFANVKAELTRSLPQEIHKYKEDRTFPNEPGFRPIFNGYDLTGWEGDERVWSVKDGAIVGNVSEGIDAEDVPLVWRGSKPIDFELRARFQFEGEDANTNAAVGYRADANGRGAMGLSLQSTFVGNIRSPGGSIGSWGKNPGPRYRPGEWNDVVVTLKGSRATHAANGQVVHENFESSHLRDAGRIVLIAPFAGHGQLKITDVRLREITRP